MPDNPRIEDLRRRVQTDPASIAFAQLAEEHRRAGQFQEAVDVCRAGLGIHPGYLSARVTLGRALIELDRPDDAQAEFELVLANAPENLAALRGVAEILHRRGALAEALGRYRTALALAPNDPDLEQTVNELARAVEPPAPIGSSDGLTFEQMQHEFLQHAPPPPAVAVTSAACT
ncbi:MAG: tetratricopeptide repeat protein [Acidobacteria bacterium]|nr:tetratricopeptide repeat protein [Acidobacteriota bacterium]